MNIVFVLGKYPGVGGVEKVTSILANCFCSDGHHVSIVAFDDTDKNSCKSDILDEEIAIHYLSSPVHKNGNIARLRNILLNDKTDIIINQWCVPFMVARMCRKAMKGMNCSLISVHHNLPNNNARIKDIELRLDKGIGSRVLNIMKLAIVKAVSRVSLRLSYDMSDSFVVLSERFFPMTEDFIMKKNAKKLIAINNPLTIDFPDHESPKDSNVIIYVGRIEYNQKRTFRVVDIWREIEDRHPDWSMVIVGDGPDKSDLQSRIDNYGLKRIRITGFTNPVPYYEKASILLLTSEYEGFGLVIVEGMCHGVVPIVYGSYPAAFDIVDDEKNGFITHMPYSQEEHCELLESLISNPQLRNEMASAAIEKAKSFSLASTVQKWYELFSQHAG